MLISNIPNDLQIMATTLMKNLKCRKDFAKIWLGDPVKCGTVRVFHPILPNENQWHPLKLLNLQLLKDTINRWQAVISGLDSNPKISQRSHHSNTKTILNFLTTISQRLLEMKSRTLLMTREIFWSSSQ